MQRIKTDILESILYNISHGILAGGTVAKHIQKIQVKQTKPYCKINILCYSIW